MQITLSFLPYHTDTERPKRVLPDETSNEKSFAV